MSGSGPADGQGGGLPTAALVAKLSKDSSPSARSEVAETVGRALDTGSLAEGERRLATDIVRRLAVDVERQVRETLAQAVRRTPDLPHEVAVTLARDIASVATPVLSESSVLTDSDLVAVVSERLKSQLVRRHALPADLATDLILDSRERATLSLVDDESAPERVEDLVRSLARGGRLTSSIIVRAACVGDMAFVETALAVMAGVPVENAGRLVHDAGRRGLEALADKAGMTPQDKVVLRAAIEAIDETELGDAPSDRDRFAETVIERVLTRFDAGEPGVSEDDAQYLIKKLENYVSHRPEAAAPPA